MFALFVDRVREAGAQIVLFGIGVRLHHCMPRLVCCFVRCFVRCYLFCSVPFSDTSQCIFDVFGVLFVSNSRSAVRSVLCSVVTGDWHICSAVCSEVMFPLMMCSVTCSVLAGSGTICSVMCSGVPKPTMLCLVMCSGLAGSGMICSVMCSGVPKQTAMCLVLCLGFAS